jgi:hypothetical protein
MNNRNNNTRKSFPSAIIAITLGSICITVQVKADEISPDTTIIVNNVAGKTIEICEGQTIKFVNNAEKAESYNWYWDLGDGSSSVLVTDVVHYYSKTDDINYHVKLKQIDGTLPDINFNIKINSFDDTTPFSYDSIYCLGQEAIISVPENDIYYSLMPSSFYSIIKDFGDDRFAIVQFIKPGESNILVNASNGICNNLIELPFLTASSNWYTFSNGKIVRKPHEANVLVFLNSAQNSVEPDDIEYKWGTYDPINGFTEDVANNKVNRNYYKTDIDSNQYRYFVKVKCVSCNSCESIYFFPRY